MNKNEMAKKDNEHKKDGLVVQIKDSLNNEKDMDGEKRSLQHLNTKRVVNYKKKPSLNEGF